MPRVDHDPDDASTWPEGPRKDEVLELERMVEARAEELEERFEELADEEEGDENIAGPKHQCPLLFILIAASMKAVFYQ